MVCYTAFPAIAVAAHTSCPTRSPGILPITCREHAVQPEGVRSTIREEKISRAIERLFGLWWTEEMKEAIRREVGAEGLAEIEEMSAFANQPDLWIHAPSTERAYDEVQILLREKYPSLSDAAVTRLATAAAYGWK
jgi:hypothetical protein